MPYVFVEPKDHSVLLSMSQGDAEGPLYHFSDVKSAVNQIEDLLGKLELSTPLDDFSDADIQGLADAADREFSLFANGLENLVRMKWVKSTTNFHVYEECDYQDNLVSKSKRKIGTTYVRVDSSDSEPEAFLAVRFRSSSPMRQEVHSE